MLANLPRLSYLGGLKIHKNMMIIVNRVGICIGITTPSLKVCPADEAAVDIDV